jgi:hypothetical protein
MRIRSLNTLAVVVAACGSVGAAIWLGSLSAAASGHPAALPNTPVQTAAGNKRAAVRDAERRLAHAALPPGTIRLSAEPAGDGGLLVRPPEEPRAEIIDRYGWWRVSAGFRSVIMFLKGHPPPGTRSRGSASQGGPGTGTPDNLMLSFYLTVRRGVLSSRALTITAVALPGGQTGIRIDAQDTWMLPRPAAEKIPAGVREIEVTSALRGQASIVSLKVVAPAKVREIIRLIDRLPIIQPGAGYYCPALKPGQPVVTFDFRATAGKRILARAQVADYGYALGPCNPIRFSIRGHDQTPLVGDGSFLTHTQHLIGTQFR